MNGKRQKHNVGRKLPEMLKRRFFHRVRQRTHFTGAVSYVPQRPRSQTIERIILACWRVIDPESVTASSGQLINRFCSKARVTTKDFWITAKIDWRLVPEVGDQMHNWLKAIQYEGNVDDLWQSIYGILKPSGAPKGGLHSRQERKQWNEAHPPPTGWQHFTGSGHSRKPGSHRS